jgi:hypothetical protein
MNRAGTAGALNFSRAAETDGDFAGFDDDRHLAPPIGKLEHARQALIVFQDIDVLVGNFTARESLPGARGVRSEIFPEDENFIVHDP